MAATTTTASDGAIDQDRAHWQLKLLDLTDQCICDLKRIWDINHGYWIIFP
jgi:hypothetical protein